jgi:hypothetical protein
MIRRGLKQAAVLGLLGLFALGVAYIGNRHLVGERHERERHFVSVHFLAVEALRADEPDGAKDLNALLEPYGGAASPLMKPFSAGLVYHSQKATFRLEEPTPRWISLFQRDRLISSHRLEPRWESSGELARKFRQP